MSILGQLLTHAHASLVCPVCTRRYTLNEISVRGIFESVIVLQTMCAKDHGPIITVLLAPIPDSRTQNPVSSEDVLDLYSALTPEVTNLSQIWIKK